MIIINKLLLYCDIFSYSYIDQLQYLQNMSYRIFIIVIKYTIFVLNILVIKILFIYQLLRFSYSLCCYSCFHILLVVYIVSYSYSSLYINLQLLIVYLFTYSLYIYLQLLIGYIVSYKNSVYIVYLFSYRFIQLIIIYIINQNCILLTYC